ncbi:hypothetical protein LROSL3_1902 [Furfurilactobacillus rossiae]|jgi:hypothetical protein|nr:hypothetical protein LROSL1_2088 [Furfurilactobacillus rossiae]QLE67251.1 hypothetical protein LROSL2_1901 [Furfurilactobacillus rossiae]QLE69681.1 hypothetical protein LROSL3_1902 [Furfurilactobacillus rossiae]
MSFTTKTVEHVCCTQEQCVCFVVDQRVVSQQV